MMGCSIITAIFDVDSLIYTSVVQMLCQTGTTVTTSAISLRKPTDSIDTSTDIIPSKSENTFIDGLIPREYIFPVLAQRMPQFARDHLKEHEEIHKGLDEYVAYIKKCSQDGAEWDGDKMRSIMDSFREVLFRHLDHEVESLRGDEMKKAFTILKIANFTSTGNWKNYGGYQCRRIELLMFKSSHTLRIPAGIFRRLESIFNNSNLCGSFKHVGTQYTRISRYRTNNWHVSLCTNLIYVSLLSLCVWTIRQVISAIKRRRSCKW
jgi:hypothetical protein